jgi:glycosyltransferase involved in cell wall biosynthesis
MLNTDGGRLRVVFVTTGYPTEDHPNNSIFIHRSIKALSYYVVPQVIHLRTWLPGRPFIEKRKWEDIPVTSVYCPQFPYLLNLHNNTKLLSKLGRILVCDYLDSPDLIHSTNLYPAGFVADQWASSIGKPHTSHVIGSDINICLSHNLARIGKDWLYNLRGVACNSVVLMNRLIELVPDIKNVRVIYRGVDSLTFAPIGHINGPQSSLPPIRFLYLGGFRTWNLRHKEYYDLKGGHILLNAWRRVEAGIYPSSLLIGGPGMDIARLQKWRATLCRPEAVFFSKAVSPEDIPSLMRACDVLVIPSLNEGLPNVANEAQACGRPVLGTDAGGIPESVLHGVTGLIVPRGDVNALASGLEWCFYHQEEMRVMGANARRHVIHNTSWGKFTEEMMSLFDSAIKQVARKM